MENTPKNFALQLGSLISLYVSVGALLTLLFSTINTVYPDATEYAYYGGDYGYTIRAAIATLLVFFPAYLILTRIVNNIRRVEASAYSALTRWLIYLSLLVGGGVLLGDLVAILLNFLNGELTIRFLLKALTVFIVVGTAFIYYALDAKSYWHTHEKESKGYGIAAVVLVIAAIILGFMNTQSPAEVREFKLDERTMNDLLSIESAVQEYYRVEGALPLGIDTAYRNTNTPVAPEGREQYTYTQTGPLVYELCAEFAHSSDVNGRNWYGTLWNHDAGHWCFKRVVFDPKN